MPAVKKAVVKKSADQKISSARRVATQAINTAALVAADAHRNRSTRTRESYKIKAEALEKVGRILSGKE